MTTTSIPMHLVVDQLTADDDPAAWKAILAVIGDEFLERYRACVRGKGAWFLRIGSCSHWWRPHHARWTAAGGFAYAVGYSANGWPGLPGFDWSVILAFDGKEWKRVEKFSGHKQIVLRVAVPSRTARHRQAAIHTIWSNSRKPIFYGFRDIEGEWICVAVSDEKEQGKILTSRELQK